MFNCSFNNSKVFFFAFFTVLWHVLFKFVLVMDNVDGFHIFGEEVQMNHGEEIQEVQEVNPAQQGNGAPP
jgi:hypothetical protein